MNLHPQMAAAAAESARIVGGVRADQLSAATPCADWDLHALLNHIILWTAYSAERRARDEQVAEELMNADFVAETGYAADFSAQLDKAVAAWSDPAAWERNLNVMGSPTPAADVAALLITEMVLHGWDAAKASGQRYTARDDVAEAVLNAVEANAELFRKYQGFAEPVQVPASAPALDRALAQSGRDPAWVPIG
ncbi:MAG TPA: TIGR03086 family metal-binding protein [Streptosporangiaceae bacterium]|nr:TIGR03086 family metal-binding protein [Streptosporangiaceae bacterium]